MERAREGAKMKPGKDPTENTFGAFYFGGTARYRNEHNRKGQEHDRVSESVFNRDLTEGLWWLGGGREGSSTHLLHNVCSLSSEKGR